jgi:hypothetical protein
MVVIGPQEELLKSPGMLLQLVGSAGQHNQEFITLQPGELSLGLQVLGLSSDIRFWSSGDTKTGPPVGLLMGA